MEQSFQKGTVLHLASLIDYSEGGIISKQLILKSASNLNGNLNCSKELEHYAS